MDASQAAQVSTPSDRELRITRTFDAPRQLVADAFTRPELLQRWMGVFGDWSWLVCEVDLREGGDYRYVWRRPDGTEMGLSGTYQEVVPGERFVFTQVYENTPEFPGEMVVTLVLSEQDGRTMAETTVRYASREERDLDLQQAPTGMEAGYAQLDSLLAALRTG